MSLSSPDSSRFLFFTLSVYITHQPFPLREIYLSLTNHPRQLSLAIPSWVGAMTTGRRAVMPCDWGVKADMVLFAGNTVWSISESIRGVCVDALYKSTYTLLYLLITEKKYYKKCLYFPYCLLLLWHNKLLFIKSNMLIRSITNVTRRVKMSRVSWWNGWHVIGLTRCN